MVGRLTRAAGARLGRGRAGLAARLAGRAGGAWPAPPALPPPPPVPPGWAPAPPDFVGVGAQKAGTTWWYALLAAHPGVVEVPGRPKEVHFFDRFWDEPWSPAGADEFARYFARPPGTVSGEWTPRYMSDWWTPPLLRAAAPDTRVLVLVRDPVERYRSGLAHVLARRFPAAPMTAEVAFSRGLYHRQLAGLLEHFPRSRLLVQQYEACRARPAEELRRTMEFLGLDPERSSVDPSMVVNPTRSAKPALDEHRSRWLADAYRAESGRLFDDFPELDPGLWPSMSAPPP